MQITGEGWAAQGRNKTRAYLRLFAGLLFCMGCGTGNGTGPSGSGSVAPVTVTIGNGGGVVAAGNATLVVPGAALTRPTKFSIEPASSAQYPADVRLVSGSAYIVSSSAGTLAASVTLSIRYNGAALKAGTHEAALRLFQDVAGVWTQVSASSVDTNNKIVSGKTTTLGVFAIL